MTQALATIQSQSPAIFPSEREWEMLKEQASLAVKSGLLPAAIKTPEAAIAIALKGRELGIPPMHAFSHIHIVQGKPTISAELMLSLIYKNCRGAVVNYLENTPKRCVIEVKRPGSKPAQFSYTIEEASAAKLTSKDSWRNYPAAMLRARTVSIAARAMFPDAIMGCSYTPEELGAEVTDEGEVISVPVVYTGPSDVLPEGPKVGVKPGVPGDDDGFQPDDYRVDFGQWRGRGPDEIYRVFGPAKIASYIEYLENSATKKGVPLSDLAVRFISEMEQVLAKYENAPLEPGSDG